MNNNALLRLQVRLQQAWINFRDGERGQTMVEYAGIALVAGAIIGIVAVAFFSLLSIIVTGRLKELGEHLNETGSFKVGVIWKSCIIVTTGVLAFMLYKEATKVLANGYEGYPEWFVNTFGWGMAIGLVIISFLLSRLPWKNLTQTQGEK